MPIWKHEHFEGGDVWLEGATADPEDEAARQTATGSHARDRPAVRAAARHGRRAASWSGTSRRRRPSQTVWNALVAEMPALGEYERTMSVAVNAEYARMATPVHDGDEVAFLPPVSGG